MPKTKISEYRDGYGLITTLSGEHTPTGYYLIMEAADGWQDTIIQQDDAKVMIHELTKFVNSKPINKR